MLMYHPFNVSHRGLSCPELTSTLLSEEVGSSMAVRSSRWVFANAVERLLHRCSQKEMLCVHEDTTRMSSFKEEPKRSQPQRLCEQAAVSPNSMCGTKERAHWLGVHVQPL